MGNQVHQTCTNCVMDTTDSKIIFDKNGVCDHCNTYYKDILPHWHTDERGKAVLNKIAKKIKREGEGKDFDCIMGMSGGVDSSYLAHITKELGLRPLIFHVDAGWNSQQAVNNIEVLTDRLRFDLYTEVVDWEEMKDLQLAFFKSGVSHIDTPQDHAYFATMYKFAHKHKIKYILTGANYSTECIRNPVEWMYYQSDLTQLLDIHKKFGEKKIKKFPLTSILNHKVYLRYFKGIQVLTPLNYVPFNKKDAIDLLTQQYSWQPYAQKHFESRFTKFYEGYWLPEKFGFDTRKVQYSSLILTGQMLRSEALEKLSTPAFDAATISEDFEYIATKLGITVKELKDYFEAPNKSFRDYKTQEGIYSIGAKIMRALGLVRAGKR